MASPKVSSKAPLSRSNIVLSTQDYKVVGTRPIRHDGTDKVTGRAQYGADIQLPGLIHAKILRSPHAHAHIKSIDTSRALAMPGVRAVLTAAELAQPSGKVEDIAEGSMANAKFVCNNCLAEDKVLYKGHAVAAVAATSPHIAEEALSLIDVEYEVLPGVFNALDAMKKGAPLLHETLATLTNGNIRMGGLRSGDDLSEGSNIANHFVYEVGDMEKGFQEADLVVEREVETVAVHQGYIEPHSATALWNSDGNLTVWCSTQGHFSVREFIAMVVGLPISKVKVVPMEIGGGFGAKIVPYLEPVAALLSKKTGHPVKITMSRSEVFEATGPTSGTVIRAKIGVDKEGRITAADASLIFEAGAYPGSPVMGATMCMFTPYDIANARIEGYDVVLNKPKAAAYRAPGAPSGAFAVETVIDEICEKIGMDPLDFRMLNGAKEGTRRITGPRNPRIGYLETLQATKEHEHYAASLCLPDTSKGSLGANDQPENMKAVQSKKWGRGVATGFWINNAGPSCTNASVNPDGTVSLVEGSADIGGSRVVVAMQMAETLGIPVEDVRPQVADTDSVGYTSVTGGSGVAFKTGVACIEAAKDMKQQMAGRAAKIWDVSPEDVEFSDGVFSHRSDPELRFSFKELAAMLNSTGGPVVGSANVSPKGFGGAFASHIVDVEVDLETGKIEILRYTALQDAGKAVHPSYVEGQMQGGVVQGIGWALNEEYFLNENGHMLNSSFLDYRMPTTLDLPMIDTVIVEVANPGHPYGVRGVGEVPLVPPLAALANAVYNAIGVRMAKLPMSPGSILDALWAKEANGGSPK